MSLICTNKPGKLVWRRGESAWRCATGMEAGLKKFWASSGTPKIRAAPEFDPVTCLSANKVLGLLQPCFFLRFDRPERRWLPVAAQLRTCKEPPHVKGRKW